MKIYKQSFIRLLSLIIVMCCWWSFKGTAQDSTMVDVNTVNIRVISNPEGSGYTNWNYISDEPGAEYWLYAYNNNGWKFVNWTCDGEVIAEDYGFYYTLPEKDATVVANYIFNPDNPANPNEPRPSHRVKVTVEPEGSGYVSPSQTSVMEGDSTYLYAYNSNGFKFKGWKVDGVLSDCTDTYISITMGKQQINVVALYEFNPASPQNPGTNNWNSETGEMLIDDFTPGNLYDAIYQKLGSWNFSPIKTLIVRGKVAENDFYVGQYSSIEVLDFSHTSGATSLPRWAFEGSQATSISLPSSITTMDGYVFYDNQNLMEINVYAFIPPTATYETFREFPNKENCIVRVPGAAVSLYEAAPYWSDFRILPFDDDLCSLTVKFPKECADGRYANNRIELVNVTTGARQKYVVTDRTEYTFIGLLKGETYTVSLLSSTGIEIGRIEDVEISDSENDAEFNTDEFLVLKNVSAEVLTPSGDNVAAQTDVEWLEPNADGTSKYLRKAVELGETPVGQKLICRVTLPQALGVVYRNPDELQVEVTETDYKFAVALDPLSSVNLSGEIIDDWGNPLSGATVTINALLNGKFSSTVAVKTGRDGKWTAEMLEAADYRITYSANECVNKYDTVAFAEVGPQGKVKLHEISSARINYGFTYTQAQKAGQNVAAADFYADYKNVNISVYNINKDKEHTNVSIQYPLLIVLDEEAAAGDKLRLTATSATGAFADIVKEVVIDADMAASVVFDVVGKGGIEMSYDTTVNPAVIAMLYDANGDLIKTVEYNTNDVASFSELEDGKYTVVSIGKSSLLNGVQRLSTLTEVGLEAGKDYVVYNATVKAGVIDEKAFAEIPAFDESRFCYTSSATSFTVNKVSATPGTYLTLRSNIDFKKLYKESGVSDVKMVFDLPKNCTFVANSVMKGKDVVPYDQDGSQVVVELGANYTEQVKFVFIPTEAGECRPTATVVFKYDGKTLQQPIGSALCTIKGLEINVPASVAREEIYVSGVAPSKSEVKVYDGNVLVGETKALANGAWTAVCTLADAYSLSAHKINAKIKTTNGLDLVTETKQCVFDPSNIEMKNVKMSFYNGWLRSTVNVDFDFEKNKITPSSYMFYTTADFTFVADLTNNDTTYVSDVTLFIYTDGGNIITLPCTYDKKKSGEDRWIASRSFSWGDLPVNMSVSYNAKTEGHIDRQQVDDIIDAAKTIFINQDNDFWAEAEKLGDAETDELTFSIIDQLASILNIPDATGAVTSEEEYAENSAAVEKFMKSDDSINFSEMQNGTKFTAEDGSTNTLYFGKYSESDPVNLDAMLCLELDNKDKVYFSCDGSSLCFVDLGRDLIVRLDVVNGAYKIPAAFATIPEYIAQFETYAVVFEGLQKTFTDFHSALSAKISENIEAHILNINPTRLNIEWLRANGEDLYPEYDKLLQLELKLNEWKNAGNAISNFFKVMKGVDISTQAKEAVASMKEWMEIIALIKTNNCPGLEQLLILANEKALEMGAGYNAAFSANIASLVFLKNGLSKGLGAAINLAIGDYALIMGNINKIEDAKWKEYIKLQIPLKKNCGKPIITPPVPPFQPTTPIHDPSGYVYEAVHSNRVEGVQASIYYLDEYEDMYGDKVKKEVLWDAEDYGQVNPLFTDKNGMYQWDVPQGMWQVKFEKEGYQTTQSEWLPVPPPQLEVNIPIVQNRQPEIVSTQAFTSEENGEITSGVKIKFDTYMDPATVNNSTVYVTVDGVRINGTIESVDLDESSDAGYATEFILRPEVNLATSQGALKLFVSLEVKSYAGVPMVASYNEDLVIERMISAIMTKASVQVEYGKDEKLIVAATPSEAAVGKILCVENSSEDVLSVLEAGEEIVFDKDGQATITLRGDLPGQSLLTFTVKKPESNIVLANGEALVNVVKELYVIKQPVADRVEKTSVYRGTGKIALSTETPNATIYYTTDGSCPCDEDARIKYTVPITLNDATVVIKAITVTNGNEESETSEFIYYVKKNDVDYKLSEGWTWVSHTFDEGLSAKEFSEKAYRVVGQTQEVIRDSKLGMVGNLKNLEPGQAYKVQLKSGNSENFRVNNFTIDPSVPIQVKAGWNWLGYSPNQSMSLAVAFGTTEFTKGDYIVGQNGFAEFNGSVWEGTLASLIPGEGYLFNSKNDKEIVYNSAAITGTVNAAARRAQAKNDTPWAVDIRKYPQVMCMVLDVQDENGNNVPLTDLYVGAFCNSECRGVGKVINGKIMMSVYGNTNDEIELHAVMNGETEEQVVDEKFKFAETIIGNVYAPHKIKVSTDITAINRLVADGLSVRIEGNKLFINDSDINAISDLTIISMDGMKMFETTKVNNVVTIPYLTSGVYTVAVVKNGKYSYSKIYIK